MVFASLGPSEKEAFFSLLDEYFASRPDVFGNAAPASSSEPSRSVPSIHVNPAGLKNAASTIHSAFTAHSNQSHESASSEPAWKRIARNPSPQPSSASAASSMGRVAAAAAMFKSSPGAPPPPRPPARRTSSTASPPQEDNEPVSPPLPSRTPSAAAKLVTHKKFGDVDVTSGKNLYMSIRHGTANKQATPPSVAPPVPPALSHIKGDKFGPPPVRRVSSTASSTPSETTRSVPPPPPPAQEEPEPEGEWAEAIYEYTSDDPGDLQLQEGQHVLIVERTSDDWWTAEYQGKRGLVPASYMKVF
ncbi:hypothetical protein PHLGIDRAFT_125956 [Phlebiopsis gigantea 11061_1 CR5-6]|uniref:SH3 domain-containing protein n=1 Tax=Phlebiopsis gigantea (strain 11061_1 CR5-6) TaxID=745531 RepID=A0A0C3S319_PHLG1|nr:hypothetical protein PHLGIDRAFT_125956 [Phlebiopsis gigantea 11061_1 CR5-6]